MTAMPDKVKILLRLPVPEGRIGDVVVVSEARAKILVDSRYATFIELVGADTAAAVETDPEPEPESASAPAETAPAAGPQVELPAKSAHKSEWVAVAEALGIDTDQNKEELIAAVTDILG